MIARRKNEGADDCGASKLQEIVGDINESCSISVNILNDLLLIDKIEEGNLILDMKLENAKSLFEPCIMNFGVQVCLHIIHVIDIFFSYLEYQAIFSNIDLSVDLSSISNVKINVDESKIVQVVRNIVR